MPHAVAPIITDMESQRVGSLLEMQHDSSEMNKDNFHCLGDWWLIISSP